MKMSFSVCFRPHEVNEDDFYKNAMRCGRVLIQEQEVSSCFFSVGLGIGGLFPTFGLEATGCDW